MTKQTIPATGKGLMWPRWLARWLARRKGYFWLPCPICHRHFAGFESAPITLMMTKRRGKPVCRECNGAAALLNKESFGIESARR